jgi:hypothetical protein
VAQLCGLRKLVLTKGTLSGAEDSLTTLLLEAVQGSALEIEISHSTVTYQELRRVEDAYLQLRASIQGSNLPHLEISWS